MNMKQDLSPSNKSHRTPRAGRWSRAAVATLAAFTLVASSCTGPGGASDDGNDPFDPALGLDDGDPQGAGGNWLAELDQLRNTPISFAASAEVGALPGRAWSDDAGAAHYAIPIDVAPGPNGFAPSLSLQYSSQSGNGLYGVGFSVAVAPEIHRCQRTLAKDGYYEELHMDATDPVCFAGQRLIRESGVYGQTGSVYRLERDLSTRVRLTGGDLDDGSATWEVNRSDGGTQQFRVHDPLRGRWLLDHTLDAFGNRMDYRWQAQPDHEIVLSSIEYGGLSNTSPNRRRVIFELDTQPRTDVREGYIRGERYVLRERIGEIRAEGLNGEVVSRYVLEYVDHPETRQSLLSSVTRVDAAGAELPATTFEWSREDATPIANNAHAVGGSYFPWTGGFGTSRRLASRGTAAIGDFNGDEATDVLVFDAGEDEYRVNGEYAFLSAHESTRPGGWGTVVGEELETVENIAYVLDGNFPTSSFQEFQSIYRGRFDDWLFMNEAHYDSFRDSVRSDLEPELVGRLHQIQPQLGISRIKFSTDDRRDHLLVPIATESPQDDGVDAWGVSRATLLRVALPNSDWEDPEGPGNLAFDDVDFPLTDPAYAVVTLEYNGDGRDDLFVCQGQGYKSSRWHLWLTRDVANTPGETYGWDVHDTGVDCSSHDEYTVLPHARGTEVLAVIPRYEDHPLPSVYGSDGAYRDEAGYTLAEWQRTAAGYRVLEFDPSAGPGTGDLSATQALPRDLYQRTTDQYCNRGLVADNQVEANGDGAPLLGAGLSRDRAIDVNGDGLRDIIRFELSGGDGTANDAAIEAETLDNGSGYAARVPACSPDANQDGVLRVYLNEGDGYAPQPIAFTFQGSPHANLWANWYGAQLVDWNADGLMDIVVPSDGTPSGDPDRDWILLLSEGDGTFTQKELFGPEWPHYVDGADTEEIFSQLGDRRTFAARHDDGSVMTVFVQPYAPEVPGISDEYGDPPYALRSGQDEGALLVRVTDGLGQWDGFRYQTTPGGRRLVSERATNVPSSDPGDSDGVYEADRNWYYEYLHPVLDPYGREVGFGSVKETLAAGTFSVVGGPPGRFVQRRFYDWTYDTDLRGYPHAGQPVTVETYAESDYLLVTGTPRLSCQVVKSWTVDPQTLPGGEIWQAYPDTVESYSLNDPADYDELDDGPVSQCADHDSPAYYTTQSLSEHTRDDYGNVVWSRRQILEGVNEDTQTTSTVEVPNYDHANWIIASPEEVRTEDCSGLDCKTRRAAISYQPNSPIPEYLHRNYGTPLEQVTRLAYDAHGNVYFVEVDAPGEKPRSVTSVWDLEGVTLLSTENTLGHVTNFVTDSATGLPMATVDPNGLTQKFFYDGFFRPVGGSYHASPLGPSDGGDLDIEYAASTVDGAVYDEIVERRGQRVVSSYDVAGRVVREMWRGVGEIPSFPQAFPPTSPDQCRWHEYDVYDNELATSEATSSCSTPPVGDEHWVTRRFDASSRNVLTQWYDDTTLVETSVSFDGLTWPGVAAGLGISAVAGIPVETTDADGHATLSIVDALGRTSATVDAMGTMTCFDYGPFGELEAVTRNCAYGASGPVETSTYDYDSSSRLTQWDEPARGVQQYTYTGYDELETLTDANGNVIEHVYDEIGRLRIRRSPGCTGRWSFDEELIGALAFQQSEDGVRQSFAYDEFGRVERTEYDVPGVAPQGSWAFEFGYTVQGQLGSITYPTGQLSPMGAGAPATLQVALGYDDADHLRSIRGVGRTLWGLNSANASGQPLVETFNIDHSFPAQTKTSSYHDFTQRLESLEVEAGGTVVQDFAYGWTPGGNLQSRSEQTTGQSETFGYDVLGRLTTIDGNLVASYDALGNFTGRDGVGNYGYLANGQLDWYGDPSNTVQHDNNGNVTRIGDLDLTWNAFDQVEQITGPGQQLNFAYDADGQRVARFDGSGFTLTLGGLFELDVDGSDRRARYFVPAGDSVVEVRDTELSPGAWDREVRYQYSDHLGSGSVLVNDDGTVEQRVSYDAWGQARDWLQWNQSFDPNLLEQFASGYTGHQPELDAGLINMRGRMYSPELARFLSVDPVVEGMGDAQTWNAYSYVLNNPLRFTDPSGFNAQPSCDDASHKDMDNCVEYTNENGQFAIASSNDDPAGGGSGGGGSVPQSVPGQSGVPGSSSGGTGNGSAGGYGGQSGVSGGEMNDRGEGGPEPTEYQAAAEQMAQMFRSTLHPAKSEQQRAFEETVNLPGQMRVQTPFDISFDKMVEVAPDAQEKVFDALFGGVVAKQGRGMIRRLIRAPRRFSSMDAGVGELANRIEHAQPGRVVGVNKKLWRKRLDGKGNEVAGDIDIELTDAVVEVKVRKKLGNAVAQAQLASKRTGKPGYIYKPNATKMQQSVVEKAGLKLLRTWYDVEQAFGDQVLGL